MAVTIRAHIPEDGLSSAAIGLGLPPSTSKGGVIRAGLAILAGKSRDEARRYATSTPDNHDLGSNGTIHTTALVPEDLLAQAENALPNNNNTAYAVRVGLAMAMGYSRKQAESWAKLPTGRPPKKQEATT